MGILEKIHQKNTKKTPFENEKTPFEKREFGDFIKTEENEQNLKKILQDFPGIYKMLEERESFFEENILLGETVEKLNFKLKDYENKENEIRSLKRTIDEIKARAEQVFREQKQKMQILEDENAKLKAENEAKRSITGFVKDKALISSFASQNKQLKEKLAKVGRLSVDDERIKKIVELHKHGYGYEKIAQSVGVSKSTACKYVKRYLAGKI